VLGARLAGYDFGQSIECTVAITLDCAIAGSVCGFIAHAVVAE
jgi:hypothetical protein